MTRLHDLIPSMSKKVIDAIGAECVYTSASGQQTISAFIDINVMDVGDFGQYTGSHIELEFLKVEVTPVRGDTALIDGVTYVVESRVISEDTSNATIRVAVHEHDKS